jgi:hypothetical protein
MHAGHEGPIPSLRNCVSDWVIGERPSTVGQHLVRDAPDIRTLHVGMRENWGEASNWDEACQSCDADEVCTHPWGNFGLGLQLEE